MRETEARVEEVMTRHVFTVAPETPFKSIVTELIYRRVSALPVVDHNRRPIGIVSEADLLLKEVRLGAEFHLLERKATNIEREKSRGLTAADVMTAPVITITPTTAVSEAARAMHARRVKRLIVVDGGGQLAGIVTRGDLLRVFLRGDDEIGAAVRTLAVRHLWLDTRDLSVRVHKGVVALLGRLDRRSNVDLLAHLASEIDGVVGVENGLTFVWDDSNERIDPLPLPFRVPAVRN